MGARDSQNLSNAAAWLLSGANDSASIAIAPDVTYAQLRDDVDALATLLAVRCPAGARILLSSARSQSAIVDMLAVIAAGLVAVPLAPDATSESCRAILASAKPVARLGDFGRRTEHLDGVSDARHLPRVRPHNSDGLVPGDVALILYTSGTTSAPKGVMITHRNLIANVTSVLQTVAITDGDVVSLVLPLHYSFGISMLCITLRAGATAVPHADVRLPSVVTEELALNGTTVLAGVALHFERFLAVGPGFGDLRLPSLRLLVCAGGPIRPAVLQQLRDRLPETQISLAYGQTEATARISHLPTEEIDRRPRSIGRGIHGVAVLVLNEHGAPVAPGDIGEIYVRGDNVMAGYVDDPEGTAQVLTPLGLRTRDQATVDIDGYIYVLGRNSDFVKFRGVRLNVLELEEAAEQLPYVNEALASLITDDAGVEALILDVVFVDGPAENPGTRFRRDLMGVLPAGKRPTIVRSVSSVPRTSNGKKLRSARQQLVPDDLVGSPR